MRLRLFSELRPTEKFISFEVGERASQIPELHGQRDQFVLMEKLGDDTVRLCTSGLLIGGLTQWQNLQVIRVRV